MLNVLWFEDQERLNWKQHFSFYFLDYHSQKSKDEHQKVTSVRPLGCRESAISEVNIKWLSTSCLLAELAWVKVGEKRSPNIRQVWKLVQLKHLAQVLLRKIFQKHICTAPNLEMIVCYRDKFGAFFVCFLKNRPVMESVTWYSELDLFLNWAALLSTVYKVIYLSRKHPNWNGIL